METIRSQEPWTILEDSRRLMAGLQDEVRELQEAYTTQDHEDTVSELGDVLYLFGALALALKREGFSLEEASLALERKLHGRRPYLEDPSLPPPRTPQEADDLWARGKALEAEERAARSR